MRGAGGRAYRRKPPALRRQLLTCPLGREKPPSITQHVCARPCPPSGISCVHVSYPRPSSSKQSAPTAVCSNRCASGRHSTNHHSTIQLHSTSATQRNTVHMQQNTAQRGSIHNMQKSDGTRSCMCILEYSSDGYIAQRLERLTADQQVPRSNPGMPFLPRVMSSHDLGKSIVPWNNEKGCSGN